MAVELTTIPAVPIIRTGTYELASGTKVFAEEDLRAAAEAWATDPAVKDPRVKIDSVAKALGLDDLTTHGGEPAFGRFTNLRVSDDGQTLLADFVGPESVAAAMEWAYPSLSIEGPAPGWVSATGRAHELVVTAVALLGVHWPGVTTLDDFHEFLASGPKIEKTDAPEEVLATMPQRTREIRAGIDVDLVARRFVAGVDDGSIERPEAVESAWTLWVAAIRLDDSGSPYLKVIDEATGSLYRVDFTVKGAEVTFGEWAEVIEQDVPVAARAANLPRPAAPLARWGSRDVMRAAVQADQPIEEAQSGMTDEQRRTLAAAHGLDPDSATEEQVIEATVAAAQTPPEPEPTPEPEPNPALVATVSRAQLDEQTRRLAELEAREAARVEAEQRTHRDGLITAALTDGRIAPTERDTWRTQLDEAPQATERLLASLTRGRVPVEERGHDGNEDAITASEGTGWFDDRFAQAGTGA